MQVVRWWAYAALTVLVAACAKGQGDSSSGSETTPVGTTDGSSTSTTDATAAETSDPGTSDDPVTDTASTTEPGTSTGTTTQSTATTMGPAPFCGDGMVMAPFEECDDGNSEDGDGCNSDCVESAKLLWSDAVDGGSAGTDEALAVAIGGDGSIHVTGYVAIADAGRDIWVRKYAPGGAVAWTVTYAGALAQDDLGRGIAVDPGDDSVYAVGYSREVDGQSNDIWVRKMDTDGTELWTRQHNDAASGSDAAFSTTLDPEGMLIVAGQSNTGGDTDVWVRKYDADGTTLWTRNHAGPGGADRVRGVATDALANVYTAGEETGADGKYKGWLRKYDADGNEIWTRTFGADNTQARLYAIAVAEDGTVNVAGSQDGDGFTQLVARGYNAAGEIQWVYTDDGSEVMGADARGIARDETGKIVVAGFEKALGGNQLLVLKLDDAGELQWDKRLVNAGTPDDVGWAVAVSDTLEPVVAGRFMFDSTGLDIWVGHFTP